MILGAEVDPMPDMAQICERRDGPGGYEVGVGDRIGISEDGRMRRKKPEFALVVSVRGDNGQDAGLGSAEVHWEGAAAQLDERQRPELRCFVGMAGQLKRTTGSFDNSWMAVAL